MKSHCNSTLCRTRKYGVGQHGDYPCINSLRKLRTQPPVWFADVDGEVLELSTDELQNYMRFHKMAMDRLNVCYRMLRNDVWLSLVSEAMQKLVEIDAPPDIGEVAEFMEHLQEYVTNRAKGTRREDMFSDRPYEEEGKHYFTLRAFQRYLESEKVRDTSRNRIISLLKKAGGGGTRQFNFENSRSLTTWWIPSDKVTAVADIPPPPMEGDKI